VDLLSLFPYPIFGTVSQNGSAQAGLSVNVKNEATGESETVTTNEYGEYLVDLANFPSGYSDGDSITVTIVDWNISASTTVDTVNYPDGREVNFNHITVADNGRICSGNGGFASRVNSCSGFRCWAG